MKSVLSLEKPNKYVSPLRKKIKIIQELERRKRNRRNEDNYEITVCIP